MTILVFRLEERKRDTSGLQKKKELSDQKSSKYSIIMEVKKKEKIQEESIKWSKEI